MTDSQEVFEVDLTIEWLRGMIDGDHVGKYELEETICSLIGMSRRIAALNTKAEKRIKWNEELAKANDRLEERVAELEADAHRYQFLRDNPHFQIEWTGELTLDEHVDAAIAGRG